MAGGNVAEPPWELGDEVEVPCDTTDYSIYWNLPSQACLQSGCTCGPPPSRMPAYENEMVHVSCTPGGVGCGGATSCLYIGTLTPL